MSPNAITKESVRFDNGNEAAALLLANAKPEDIVAALNLQPCKAVMIILGQADDSNGPRLTQLFGRGIARAAADGTVIIDNGAPASIGAMMGQALAGRGRQCPLVGVALASSVIDSNGAANSKALEPNHTHFVLVDDKSSGSESQTIFALAKALTTNKAPAVAVLAGGGPASGDDVLRAVRQNIPVIVVEGSGGFADKIAAAWKQRTTLPDDPDPVLAEIIADGRIHLHMLSNPVQGIERLIIRESGGDSVLLQAWERFADYDLNAKTQQRRFTRLQLAIVLLGIVATTLAITKQVAHPDPVYLQDVREAFSKDAATAVPTAAPTPPATGTATPTAPATPTALASWWIVRQTLIVIPILLTVLVAAANRFKQGDKWLLLRGGAESIKREIYRYRTMRYREDSAQQLSQKLGEITERTMRTQVNQSAMERYQKENGFPPYMDAAQGGDDGFSYLSPDRYVEVRLGDQLNYFRKRSVALDLQLRILYWSTFVIGGVGTYLAAIDQQVWIAVTTAMVAGIGTYLGFKQIENTLTKYNQVATDLDNVRAWWNALPAEEQANQDNIDSLVQHTEQVLQTELDGWVQQMQTAIAELRKDQEAKAQKKEEKKAEDEDQPQDSEATGKDSSQSAKDQTDIQQQTATDAKLETPPAADVKSEQPDRNGNDGSHGNEASEIKDDRQQPGAKPPSAEGVTIEGNGAQP